MSSNAARTYPATVLRVIDGDTLEVRADLGFHVHSDVTLRLRGAYAPELSEPGGFAACGYVEGLLKTHGPNVTVTTYKAGQNELRSFTRYVADVWLSDGTSLVWRLFGSKHARATP